MPSMLVRQSWPGLARSASVFTLRDGNCYQLDSLARESEGLELLALRRRRGFRSHYVASRLVSSRPKPVEATSKSTSRVMIAASKESKMLCSRASRWLEIGSWKF